MKFIVVVIAALLIAGCDRNGPAQQVADYKICTDGGMDAYMTAAGEIRCRP